MIGIPTTVFVTFVLFSISGARGEADPEAKNSEEIFLSNTIAPVSLEDLKNDELGSWEPPKYIREGFPYYISGYDEEKRPIFIFEFGKYNFKATLAKGEKAEDDTTRYFDQSILIIKKLAKDNAIDGPGEVVVVYDFDGFSLEHVNSVAVSRLALKQFSKFGELASLVGYGFFLNTNFLSAGFINAARPFIGTLLEKFEEYGTRKDIWLPKMLRKLPREELPPWYGGDKDHTPVMVFG